MLIVVVDGWGEKGFKLFICDGFFIVIVWDLKEFYRDERVLIKYLKEVEVDNF